MCKFRRLKASEIECRVGTVKEGKGFSLLLYKDARCDMRILDETVGAMNWQKHYSRENSNCIVSIWDEKKNQWIEKEDVGTESKTESEKGLASDSFKRACFAWGIGRELYTAPFIWVSGYDKYDKFSVTNISYDEDGNIAELEIIEVKSGDVVFSTVKKVTPKAQTSSPIMPMPISPQQKADILKEVNRTRCRLEDICERYSIKTIDDLPARKFDSVMKILLQMESR